MRNWGIRRSALGVLFATLGGAMAALPLLTPAVGQGAGQKPASPATDYAHVSPILRGQCASCHSPQGGAPFSLLTYEDAKQWGGQILDVTQSRYMPPWLPAPGKGDFAGARRLSDSDLAAIRAWVGAGMPGASAQPDGAAASSATLPSPAEWSLGKPDAVLTLPEPVKLPGNGPDVFTNLIVPVAVTQSRVLRAIQFRPSDPQAVRSIRLGVDRDGMLMKQEGWMQGVAGMEPPAAAENPPGLLVWSPGAAAILPAAGERWELQPGSDLVLTTHLKTTGRRQMLQMEVALYYAPASAAPATAIVLSLAHKGPIDLPAGAASVQIEDSDTLPQAAAVTAIYPRAHFLARSLDAYATTPAGKQIALLAIPRWDVDWVEVYRYRTPVQLPAGSVVHWKYVYDNSSQNPHNPSDPPVDAHQGSGPKDEQPGVVLELLPPPGANATAWRKSMTAK